MEFNKKLQELRKQKGITQEELAKNLFVSRTAISKWELGRGYPNIESLKSIAKFFSITVDDLLSADEVLTIAEEDNRQKENHFCDLIYGLLDLCFVMLLFLPFFAKKTEEVVLSVSLISLDIVPIYLRIIYIAVVISTIIMGILFLALQNCKVMIWLKSKTILSLILGVSSVLIFTISSQPYPAVFTFILLCIKVLVLAKRQ